jgi:hypothetical protein
VPNSNKTMTRMIRSCQMLMPPKPISIPFYLPFGALD